MLSGGEFGRIRKAQAEKNLQAYFAWRRARVEKVRHLLEELKTIPHLELDLPIKLPEIQREVRAITDWPRARFMPDGVGQEMRTAYNENVKAHVVTSFRPVQSDWLEEGINQWDRPDASFNAGPELRYFQTPLARQLPHVVELIRSFQPGLTYSGLFKYRAGYCIPWHSHHNSFYFMQKDYVHGFLVTTLDGDEGMTLNEVRHFKTFEGATAMRYKMGSTFLFNGWHQHQVTNQGKRERVALLQFVDLLREGVLERLLPTINAYAGPRVHDSAGSPVCPSNR